MSQDYALIIDDNAKNVNVLAQLLSMEQFESVKVFNPSELDSLLKTLPPVKVVFLDLEMPTLDGYTILERLKSDPRFQNIPIVAYTVHLSEINVAYQQGFDSFIGKPLDADKFPEQLARILEGESVWETS